MVNVMDLKEEEFIYPGTRACAGCGMALIYRIALKALGPKTILTVPASCLTVLHGMQGFCSTKLSVLHTPFATTGASASGIVASLDDKGLSDEICVVAFAGDGGTTDIGIQSLSGAAERGTNFIYACYDNEAYMNTGVQRSGSTPLGAFSTTTPMGKDGHKKNMPKILEAHGIPYVATACASYPLDLYEKFQKAREIKGPKYIHILAPCPPGWGYEPKDTIKIGRLAVETGFWPLYEIENGRMTLSRPSKKYSDEQKRKPIKEYLETQKRFKSLDNNTVQNYEQYINDLWSEVNQRLEREQE
ncbi:MAG: pyruvate synthase subunit beta [Candidatus Lokiarchaeota archaeon]|jgi:pyruvate ferredoxin oxidoreductase beta subunit|nr:pyruvate synthase subunit beta [Candidatus Lokiarchaeota archaeon]MBD3202115.1 pyruvate synthase subunit beta [Candidatus Lokiarchaeota archaeon]